MDLANCILRPGKVLKVVNNYGVVKASALGYFSEKDDPDLLPPIMQFMRMSPTTFSEPHVGDEIWVWINTKNPLELFYTFQGDAGLTNSEILDQQYEDCEIISSRDGGNSGIQYNNEDGWKMHNNGNQVSISPDGKVILSQNDNKHVVEISENGFKFATSGGTQEPAVLGTKLTECLQSLISGLQNAASIGKANPYTTPMAIAIEGALMEFNAKLNQILSKNMTID